MKKQLFFGLLAAVVLIVITAVSSQFFNILGLTGITMLYLLLVVAVAYFQTFYFATFIAFATFFIINYFFIAPVYTFQISHIESWASLISFLAVSLVVSSLVKRLKFQTNQSITAYERAEFSRKLAEHLALSENIDCLLKESCALLNNAFNNTFLIYIPDENKQSNDEQQDINIVDKNALDWVSSNGKPIGPFTGNWPESEHLIIPFNRLPSKDPVMLISDAKSVANIETYHYMRLIVDQIATAYQRLNQQKRLRNAEFMAQEEAIQSALLASIAHDMRTPLTSILGAATTLEQKQIHLDANQFQRLASIITSQAQYLASTTENILSLVKLESKSAQDTPMELQSVEEMIGIVSALFADRGSGIRFKIHIQDNDLLIKANLHLLIQSLVNLIENAHQANIIAGNNDAEIEIDALKIDQKIRLSIGDNGNGFDDDFDVSQIKKFNSSHPKGFGLGLSIIQAVAQLHHASLIIRNKTEGGAAIALDFDTPEIAVADAR